jgi:hypothetical protein
MGRGLLFVVMYSINIWSLRDQEKSDKFLSLYNVMSASLERLRYSSEGDIVAYGWQQE